MLSAMYAVIGYDIGSTNVELLRASFPTIAFEVCLDEEAIARAAPRMEILFSKSAFGAAVTDAPRLRWVQAGTAGVEHWLETGILARGVRLTTATGAHGVPIAEQTIAMMLAFATGLHTLVRNQALPPGADPRSVSRTVMPAKFELEGQTVCVVGLGDIGGTLARKCGALGMQVIGVNRSGRAVDGVDELVTIDRLTGALARADHAALCLPLTHATHRLVGERELRVMRSSAFIYNTGRGASIDPDALIAALRDGSIAGAGLDVTEPEPLPIDSPLRAMPNVILGAHTSGSSPHNSDRITRIFAANLKRYLAGEPLVGEVEESRGY